jgi:hypothetical protein
VFVAGEEEVQGGGEPAFDPRHAAPEVMIPRVDPATVLADVLHPNNVLVVPKVPLPPPATRLCARVSGPPHCLKDLDTFQIVERVYERMQEVVSALAGSQGASVGREPGLTESLNWAAGAEYVKCLYCDRFGSEVDAQSPVGAITRCETTTLLSRPQNRDCCVCATPGSLRSHDDDDMSSEAASSNSTSKPANGYCSR